MSDLTPSMPNEIPPDAPTAGIEAESPRPDAAPQEVGEISESATTKTSDATPLAFADDNALIQSLTDQLSTTESGIAFIYDALAIAMTHWQLRDIVLVADEPPAGRQLFRVGHQSVTEHWAPESVEKSSVGLYPVPDIVPADTSAQVANLCALALRIDLLRHDATHDPLTGLLNRRSFERLLDQAVSRSERYGWPFALVLLDLNDFKDVNDHYGHQVGDQVLSAIGAELRRELRTGDVAGRLGGDEFAVILNESNPSAIPSLVHRLIEAPSKADVDVPIGFSYGLALAPVDAVESNKLYLLADQRLYDAKAEKNEAKRAKSAENPAQNEDSDV